MVETKNHKVLAIKVWDLVQRSSCWVVWFKNGDAKTREYYDFRTFVVYEISKIKCLMEQLTRGEVKGVLRREVVDRR